MNKIQQNKNFTMKQFLILITFIFVVSATNAQDNIVPAPAQKETIVIQNGTIYTATGRVINNGSIVISDGKIQSVEANVNVPANAQVIDATGKNVYPGLILANTDLGLKEIGSGVRGSNDYYELGDYNPGVRSIVAYDATSVIINTLRSNGILLANVSPRGGLLTGSSSVVQLDAWNWEDAIYSADNGMFLDMPLLMQPVRRSFRAVSTRDPVKEGIDKLVEVQQFFSEAKAYYLQANKKETNLKFEALRPLFDKKQKLFINASIARQILMAIDFKKKFDIDVVIVGGEDSYLVAGLLKQSNIPVILNTMYNLPTMEDDDIDQPFKTPAVLQKAGVLFAINDNDASARYRNLAFNAGTAIAHGLTPEQALKAVTSNAAKILGISDKTGSLEPGKDANIIIATGDVFDIRSGIITDAFIQGRRINLENKQTQLYERYKGRYGLK